ncbi:MAG: hypothetical protein NUV34_08960 [Sulfuricaulis sp.]|nr:hypothetical protein [Sulfuricaulis sp.]
MLDGAGALIIEEANAGVTCPSGDASELSSAVRKMAAMPKADRTALGRNGRAYARSEFDRERLMVRLDELLTDISASGRAGRAHDGSGR